jgi:hypothetical protein
MMNVADVTRIATDAARQEAPDLRVMGVTLTTGGSEYVEVILNVEGCRKEPCRVALGVLRSLPEPALRAEIAGQLRRHVRAHGG